MGAYVRNPSKSLLLYALWRCGKFSFLFVWIELFEFRYVHNYLLDYYINLILYMYHIAMPEMMGTILYLSVLFTRNPSTSGKKLYG